MSTVRRSLLVLLVLGVSLIALVGLVGSISALSAARSVDELVDDVRPAANAAALLHQDALAASASVRSFAIADDEEELASYRRTVERMGEDGAPLDAYARSRPELRAMHEAVQEAFDAWVRDYAEPRIDRGGGPGTYDALLYLKGASLFREVEARLDALHDAVEDDYARVQADTDQQLDATIALVAAASVIGTLMLGVLGWWIAASIQRPLASLERTVTRLRDGDLEARASVGGPREVRKVAEAVNEFADQSTRARDVEVQVQRQVREVDAAKNEFVANVSHELRTPLTIISGYLELLADDLREQVTDEQNNMLHVAQRNVMRLRELIEDLLTLNRAEESGTALELVDLREVAAEVVNDMRFAATNRGLTLTLVRPEEAVTVLGDPHQLHRAVINVVGNAVKFSDVGGQVEVEVADSGESGRVRVTDQGLGIPADELDQIGSRFYRASNAVRSEVAGTGLGLRIVQTIVSNHHGSLSLASRIGEGTVVTLTLPLVRESVDAEEQSGTLPG